MKIENFGQPTWALNGHSQTLVAHLMNQKPKLDSSESIYIPTNDGDKLLLKIHKRNPDRWLVLAHGLAGSSESSYILRLTQKVMKKNISVVRFNHRNCGDSLGTSQKPYHSGRGEDLFAAVKYLNEKYPSAEVVVVGYSLSGNVILNMLTRFEKQMSLKLAISVNGAIDLAASAKSFLKADNLIYDKYFVNLLRGLNKKLYPNGFFDALSEAGKRQISLKELQARLPLRANLIDYDNQFTAPLAGYKDAWDYYQSCSSKNFIQNITTPTVILTAQDDPIIPVNSFLSLHLPANIELAVQKFGGHLGYLTKKKTPLGDHRWMDWFLMEKITKSLGL